MPRKDRSDIKIGNLEKKLGLAKGAIRNPDGSDARSDKKLGTLREEYRALYGNRPVRKNATIIAAATKSAPAAASTKKATVKKTASSSSSTSTKKAGGTVAKSTAASPAKRSADNTRRKK
ncbi:hypothetical protein GCM10011375_18960 [Hymenobacter qilianensis]|uniref:Uncharacterized protein n=2 Tax=Hymenobacter qilianensis TaxID=1385715 RepID=A0ACB5PR88_9BACT|nr:hypothetical protein [Hymenobacter qilianensis]QNP54206.1 hypothetical protein H9L05_19600 [Hymenobacter qilianensis]GGF64295.1 hypothetical protein GCM10011375_18960 [Hymenobacter qilianensis]